MPTPADDEKRAGLLQGLFYPNNSRAPIERKRGALTTR
jgi:hypothetical protein